MTAKQVYLDIAERNDVITVGNIFKRCAHSAIYPALTIDISNIRNTLYPWSSGSIKLDKKQLNTIHTITKHFLECKACQGVLNDDFFLDRVIKLSIKTRGILTRILDEEEQELQAKCKEQAEAVYKCGSAMLSTPLTPLDLPVKTRTGEE